MKQQLNSNQYQLNNAERENLWHGIRRETHGTGRGRAPRGAFRPALAVAAFAATLTLVVAWQLGSRQVLQGSPEPALEVASLDLMDETEGQRADPQVVQPKEVEPNLAQAQSARSRQDEIAAAPAPAEENPRAADLPTAPRTVAKAAISGIARSGPELTGRVRDRETGEALAYATVLIRGTTHAAVTDSLGRFHFANLAPGGQVDLVVKMLSYDSFELALSLPATGRLDREVELDPIVVETLQAFDVAGAEYMVEVKNGVTEHSVTSETFDKYAIDSVQDAQNKKAGVVMRGDEIATPGGRSGQASAPLMGRARTEEQARRPAGVQPQEYRLKRYGSVTGGTTPPNGAQVELMYFESAGVNPFVATEEDALSTFALDVDTASWTMARSYLDRGMLPPRDAIRVEEFVNAFDAGWRRHTDETFRIHSEGGASRFGDGLHLLRVGLVGKSVDASRRKPANLVFVIDVSGSMARESRLGTVKQALHILLNELREGDRVGLVIYGSQGQVRLPLTDISHRAKIAAAIDALQTGGSTNVAEGLLLAYRMARESYDPAVINRLVLCSDGVANNGMSTEAGGILSLVRRSSDEGITLSTVGFGMGNYNDVLMEKLADEGDGNYAYVDKLEEAERVFRRNLTGMLQTIAREVKVQVEFDPTQVKRWRLLGYENRDVADKDFRNDAVDAGEVGAGHQVTAIYELKLTHPAEREELWENDVSLDEYDSGAGSGATPIGVVRLRHEAPAHDSKRAGEVLEITQPLLLSQLQGGYGNGSPTQRVQTVVAEFAELLRGSYWAKGHSLAQLVPVADALATELPGDQQVQDLARMVRRAADLQAAATRMVPTDDRD